MEKREILHEMTVSTVLEISIECIHAILEQARRAKVPESAYSAMEALQNRVVKLTGNVVPDRTPGSVAARLSDPRSTPPSPGRRASSSKGTAVLLDISAPLTAEE